MFQLCTSKIADHHFSLPAKLNKNGVNMKILAFKVILFCVPVLMAGRCSREPETPIPQVNLAEFGLDATFDVGENYTFKQYVPVETNMGKQTAGCNFLGNQMSIGFGALNYLDPNKSNGFHVGFSVDNVTHEGLYEFREEDRAGKNISGYTKRTSSGLITSIPSPLMAYDNRKNYWRLPPDADGRCKEQEMQVGVQSIDITKYSSEDGGVIEGSFHINVYHKPESKCAQYQHQLITGNFKLKRVNMPQ
jgi:hypothetical protein